MTPEARQRSVRLLVRILISAVLFVIFSLHVQGARSWELLERIEAYLYDARVRLTMPNTVDDRITRGSANDGCRVIKRLRRSLRESGSILGDFLNAARQ